MRINVFFPNGIGYEVTCEAAPIYCTIDMLSYKAYLVRWMAAATKVAPFTGGPVRVTLVLVSMTLLRKTQQRSGLAPKVTGLAWGS